MQGPNDVPVPYISVSVSYYLKPVEANLISNNVVTPLDENHIDKINNVDIKNMCLQIEFGREKTHMNGTKYIPVFAQKIWVEISPNYISEKYAYLNQPPIESDGQLPF